MAMCAQSMLQPRGNLDTALPSGRFRRGVFWRPRCLTAVSRQGSGSAVAGSLHSTNWSFGLSKQLRVVWTKTSPFLARVQNNYNKHQTPDNQTPKQHPNNSQTTPTQHPHNTHTTPKQHPNNTHTQAPTHRVWLCTHLESALGFWFCERLEHGLLLVKLVHHPNHSTRVAVDSIGRSVLAKFSTDSRSTGHPHLSPEPMSVASSRHEKQRLQGSSNHAHAVLES